MDLPLEFPLSILWPTIGVENTKATLFGNYSGAWFPNGKTKSDCILDFNSSVEKLKSDIYLLVHLIQSKTKATMDQK